MELGMEERRCPKHVEFHTKNKFAKLVHLVGLIIKEICPSSSLSFFFKVVKSFLWNNNDYP